MAAKGGRGCEEHHRRCREWPRNANTFHAGSVVTSVSSQFDLLTADLTKYEAALEALRELDLELEEDVDQLSPGSASRENPRFNQAGRARELEDEKEPLGQTLGTAPTAWRTRGPPTGGRRGRAAGCGDN